MPTKRRSGGFPLHAVRRHKSSKLGIKNHAVYSQNAINFTSDSSEAIFSFTTPSIPVRFLNSPIEVTYYVRIPNAAYKDATQTPNESEYKYPNNAKKCWMMPNVPYNFFARTSLTFNGHNIYDSDTLSGAYIQANRYLSTSKDRQTVLGSDLEVAKRMNITGTNYTPYITDVLYSVTTTDKNRPKKVRLAMDGSGYLGPAKAFSTSVMHNFDAKHNLACIIPPETRVGIRFKLHDDSSKFIINDGITDTKLLSKDAESDDMSVQDMEVVITDVKVLYETLDIPNATLFPKTEFRQFFDTHNCSTDDFATGTIGTVALNKGIPDSAKGVIIGFAPEEFHWYTDASNKPASYRFTFPDALSKFHVSVDGHPLEFAEGLEGLGGLSAQTRSGGGRLYNYLTSLGLIDRRISEMFPLGGDSRGYTHLVYFDLTIPEIKDLKNKSLRTNLEFSKALTKKWNMFYMFVCEQEISRLKNGIWERSHLL